MNLDDLVSGFKELGIDIDKDEASKVNRLNDIILIMIIKQNLILSNIVAI